MDSIFFVEEEDIDFDDDIEFNINKNKENINNPKEISVHNNKKEKEINASTQIKAMSPNSRDNGFKFKKTGNSCDLALNKRSGAEINIQHQIKTIEKNNTDIILNNFLIDGTDELLSQIEIPMNVDDICRNKSTDTHIKSKSDSDNRVPCTMVNNKNNAITEHRNTYESLQRTAISNPCNGGIQETLPQTSTTNRYTESQQRQPLYNAGKNHQQHFTPIRNYDSQRNNQQHFTPISNHDSQRNNQQHFTPISNDDSQRNNQQHFTPIRNDDSAKNNQQDFNLIRNDDSAKNKQHFTPIRNYNIQNNNQQHFTPTEKLPTPFSNNKPVDSNIFTSRQSANTCDNVTPIKPASLQPMVRSNKRKYPAPTEKTTPKPTLSRQRRFPGPAGLLPSLNNFSELENLKSPEGCKGKRILTPLTPKPEDQPFLTLSQDDDFTRTIWMDVKKQVRQLFPATNVEMISRILQKATMNHLTNGKVVLCCGLIKSFTLTGSSGKLILKDPSGEINGTVHKHVLDEYEQDMCQGTGLILKDITVFSPSLKKHYVNITPSNIVQIFPAEEVMATQSQSTQLLRGNTDTEKFLERITQSTQLPGMSTNNQRISTENENMFVDNILPETSGYRSKHSNEKSADMFGNEEDIDNFFSDDLCPF